MRRLLLLLITLTTFMSCDTMKELMESSNSNLLSGIQKKTAQSYRPSDPFPKDGYKIKGGTYRDIEVHKFTDNDTLYYIAYKHYQKKDGFYFSVIDRMTANAILENALNNKNIPDAYERQKWLDYTLEELGIEDLSIKNKRWTYFRPKDKMVKGNLPTDRVRTGWHHEKEKLTYKVAQRVYCTRTI